MEWLIVAGVAALVVIIVLVAVLRRRAAGRRASGRSGEDPHLAWVHELKDQVSRRRPDDRTQPWSRDD